MSTLSSDQWHEVSPYLDEALGMTDEERSLWLTSLRLRNSELAAQMEELIEEHRVLSEEGFLEECPIGLPGDLGLAGQTFGAYKLISQIGHGGMGSVWLAERNDGRFERRVAVKILNIALIGKAGEEQFKREGNILGRLAHPHIAQLLDAGVARGGQPYLVLEHVDGEHIDRYCDQRLLNVEARARLFLDVLEAISHAHVHLIVHRDIKPSNVLVTTEAQVKLLDFGIAKLLEEQGRVGAATLSHEGGWMTPEYAAPEQVTGGPVTTATDVYGLGVLLYALMTGQHPAGQGPHSAADLIKAIVDMDPRRLSHVVARGSSEAGMVTNAARRSTTPDQLRRLLHGDLETIAAKALKKNPQERYASVRDLADDLRRYLRHEPISARPDTIAYRAGKFVRRHRNSMIAALLVITALAGATTVTWLVSRRPEPLRELPQRRLTANVQDSPVLSAAISPDGKYLGYTDQQGIHLQLVQTGETQNVQLPSVIHAGTASWVFGSWYADSARFIASVTIPGQPVSLWSVPIQGEGAQKLAEVENMVGGGRLSPDGSQIAYERFPRAVGAREIWLMGSHGESPHRIRTAQSQARFGDIAWSPAGNRIAYIYAQEQEDGRTDMSVRSCDLSGAGDATILHDDKLNAFAWIPSGRFIFSRSGENRQAESDNLWELQVDQNGSPQGEVRRLTDWSGFLIYAFSATADGKHLTFLRSNEHGSAYVADFDNHERRLVNFHRLTMDDNINFPLAWTPDSREVIFSSPRAGIRLMFKQALDPRSAPQLLTTTTGMNFYLARLSPDGAWMLLEGQPGNSSGLALYRVAISGGVPQLLFRMEGYFQFWCTNKAADFCVFGQASENKNELVINAFDPLGGKGKELLRIPLEPGTSAGIGDDYAWQLSPNGLWIGIVKKHENRIGLVPLDGGPTRVIAIKGYSDLVDLNWANDSHSMFVSSQGPGGVSLLHVDLNGNAEPIGQQPRALWAWGFPSPDGHHLAMMVGNLETSVWMIGNF
jgi:serine/threonine protein kinase/Tol biopolymer transport system component